MTDEMTCCIDTCLSCYKTGVSTAMNYCLEIGGNLSHQKFSNPATTLAEALDILETSESFQKGSEGSIRVEEGD